MKKIQVNSAKLQLNKKTIADLTSSQMNNVIGGANVDAQAGDAAAAGLFSIGHACSVRNSCARLSNRGECVCCNQPNVADQAQAL